MNTDLQPSLNGQSCVGDGEPTDVSSALAVIGRDRDRRIADCGAEIDRILKHYRCQFDMTVVLRRGNVESQLNLVALE